MPLSTDVNLPRNHQARFPSSCIQCNNDANGNTLRLRPHLTLSLINSESRFSVEIPACQRCSLQIRFRRTCLVLISIVVVFGVMFLVWPHLKNFVPDHLHKWTIIGLVLTCLLPFILFSVFFPPVIDLEVDTLTHSVDYQFRKSEYAASFAKLNDDADWVKIE